MQENMRTKFDYSKLTRSYLPKYETIVERFIQLGKHVTIVFIDYKVM